MIKIEVHSTRAVIRSQEPLTVGLRGAMARFVFGKPWETLIKTAVFRQGDKTVTMADIGVDVTIPWEVLTQPGLPVLIGVYGSDSTGTVAIPTVWVTTQSVRPGTDPEGDPSTAPTPGLWEQLQGKMGSLEQLNTKEKSSLVAAINEANRSVRMFTVFQEDDGSCSSDYDMHEIQTALDQGALPVCYWYNKDIVLHLVDYQENVACTFTAVSGSVEYKVSIACDGSIECTTSTLATENSIPTKVSELENDSGYLTDAPVTSVNGQTGDITLSTAVKVTVTQQSDGTYTADLSCAKILEVYNSGCLVYCQQGNRVLPLLVASKAFCSFGCVYGGNVYSVTVGVRSVAVSAVPLASGGDSGGGADGVTPHIGDNGNWFIGDTDTGMPSRGEPGPQGNSGVYVGPGEIPEGYNIQIDPTGEAPALVQSVNGVKPDENGNVEVPTAPDSKYTLPIAKPDTLGGVQPVAKSEDMTQPVGVDETGRLWTAPFAGNGESGGTGGNANICDFTVTSEQAVSGITVEMPATLNRFYIVNFLISFGDGLTEKTTLYTKVGNSNHKNYGMLDVGIKEFNLFGLRYTDEYWQVGYSSSNVVSNAPPKMPAAITGIKGQDKAITFYSNTSGVDFPAGTSISVWGVYYQ